MKSELVKRLIVDSENLSFYHKKFFNDEDLSEDDKLFIIG